MDPYKYQAVAKARIRKNDHICFRLEENGPVITGCVLKVSCTRHTSGAYTEVYVGGDAAGGYKYGKWYETEKMLIMDHLDLPDEGRCHLMITYHMRCNHGTLLDPVMEEAESCIMLPMTAEIADDILQNGADSKHVDKILGGGVICEALESICEAQGYEYTGFCTAEQVFLSDYCRKDTEDKIL